MKIKLRNILLVVVDSHLIFAIICVLPFAWILRDGLGPDSVRTSGLTAVKRTFMTFYTGPAILLLVSFDLMLRSRRDPEGSIVSRKQFIFPVIVTLILIALGALSFRLLSGN